ncbi:7549_t:CDS:2, partial [Dentiscutata erythropus]
ISLSSGKYPEDNPFSLKQNNATYTTSYRIPDNYVVQTRWGRGRSQHVIDCEIKYKIDGPVYIIRFEKDEQSFVITSKKSVTKVVNEYLKKRNPDTQAQLSGVHVFGLNTIDVEKERERKNQSHPFKPFNILGKSMKEKHSHIFSKQIGIAFKNEIHKFYNPIDQPILQELRFNVQEKNYIVDYRNRNRDKKNNHIEAVTKIVDQGLISQKSYRNLAAIQHELLRDYDVSNARKKINDEMNQKVPVSILNIANISLITTNELPDITDQEIEEEMMRYIGNAGYRRITDILRFVILDLLNRQVLNINNPIIYIHISGMA